MSTAEEPSIRLCKGDCGRMTRPPGTRPSGEVETVARSDSKYCTTCYSRFSPAVKAKRAREAAARQADKDAALIAAFRVRDEIAAGRARRAEEADRRILAEKARQEHALLLRQHQRASA